MPILTDGLPAAAPEETPFPQRMARFVAYCEGKTETLDRADAQAILQATREMSQRVFRQLMALNTMQQSLPLIHKALSNSITLIDAFNTKVAEIDAVRKTPTPPPFVPDKLGEAN